MVGCHAAPARRGREISHRRQRQHARRVDGQSAGHTFSDASAAVPRLSLLASLRVALTMARRRDRSRRVGCWSSTTALELRPACARVHAKLAGMIWALRRSHYCSRDQNEVRWPGSCFSFLAAAFPAPKSALPPGTPIMACCTLHRRRSSFPAGSSTLAPRQTHSRSMPQARPISYFPSSAPLITFLTLFFCIQHIHVRALAAPTLFKYQLSASISILPCRRTTT